MSQQQIQASMQAQEKRIAFLKEFGIKAHRGSVLGSLTLYATDAAKLVKLLKKLKRLQLEQASSVVDWEASQ